MEESPVKLSKRPGSSDSGRLYELKVAALLALRCVENPKVKQAWFASNVDHAHDFDDVILYVKDENDLCTAYLMQLKHQDFPKNIPRKDFLYDSKTKKKSNMSEDFSLFKYQRSYLKIKKSLAGPVKEEGKDGLIGSLLNADSIFYVLYTNRPLGAKYHFLNVSGDERSLLNTSDGGCNVYGFDPEALELDGDFLRHLHLFTQQKHVTKIDELIKKELKRVMETDHVLKKYLDFVEMRNKGINNSTLDALTKTELVAQLTSFLLDDYVVKFSLNGSSRSEFLLWDELVDGKALVMVEATEFTSEFLTSYLSAKIAEHCNLDNWNQELSKKSFYKKFPNLKSILVKTVGEGSLTAFSIHQALWLQKKVPLLLHAQTLKDLKRIEAALHLSRDGNYPVFVLTSVGTCTTSNRLFDLNHLDQKHQNLILEHTITLQGRPGARLGDVVNKSMHKMIKCGDIIDIISNRFNIGNGQGTMLQFYVPRAVSKVLFRPHTLTEINSKLLIRGIDRTTFKQIFKDISSGESGIIFENELTARNQLKDYHDFRIVNEDLFELERCSANVKSLREHQVVQLQSLDAPDCCWLHPEELEKLLDQSPCVINANPGMGKTELLNHFSLNAPVSHWVIKVNLNEHHDYFKTLKDATVTALDHLNYFYDGSHSSKQELTEKVFFKFAKQKNVLVLLDGFDEISMTYKNEATSIATCLHEAGYKICVSTRPVTKAHLEDALNTISRTLKPLEIEDQEFFLTQYFGDMVGNAEQKQTMVEFVEKLLRAAAANLNDSDNRFTGLPLQTKLLADVFKKDLEKILKTGKFLFNDKFDLIFLYDSFLKEKTNIFCRKFGDIYRDMQKFFDKLQQLFALQIVFPAYLLEKLRVEQKLKEYYEDDDRIVHFLQREGVLVIYQRETDSEEKFDVNFVHRTFAEFLAAKWLYRTYKIENVRDLIKCRFEEENDFLFNVFDRYLAKDLPLHLSIINRNKCEALELVRLDPKSIGRVDSGGRTILHLISCYGLDHSSYYTGAVVDEMVEVIDALPERVITDAKDDLLGYSALEYAISSNTLGIADKLCHHSRKVQFSLHLHERYSIFFHCDLNRYKDLFFLILVYFSRAELLEKHVKPFAFVDDYCFSLTNLMEYATKYKSKTVLDLVRSTCSDRDIGFTAAFGSKEELLSLLEKGVSVHKLDSSLGSALHYASIHNRVENAKLLISKVSGHKRYVNLQNDEGKTALHLAIQNQNFGVAHLLVDEGADINLPDASGTTAFLYACEYGKNHLVKQILPMITDLNLQNDNSQSALHLSIKNPNFDVVHTLIDAGADVNLTDDSGATVLLHACKSRKVELVKKLLPMVADVNWQNDKGETALHHALRNKNFDVAHALIDEGADVGRTAFLRACEHGNVDLVQKILPKIADVNILNEKGESVLHNALRRKNFDVAHALIDAGADVNLIDCTNFPVFLYASAFNRIELVKKICPMVADINVQDEYGASALHIALNNNFYDIAQVLVDQGADVNLPDFSGTTAFLYACQSDEVDFVKKVLPMVTDINSQNQKGKSALHQALQYWTFCVAHALIDEGVDVNLTDHRKETALFYACRSGRVDVVKKILPMVTNIDLQNGKNESALNLATKHQSFDVAHALTDAGADVNLVNSFGTTAFLYACEDGQIDLVIKLLPKVIDINLQNKKSESALHLSIKNRHFDVAHALIVAGADVNLTDRTGTTAFLYAYKCENIDLINKLLPMVADINFRNMEGESALHLAIQNQNFDVAHALLAAGADVNLVNASNTTAFLHACASDKIELVEKMLPMVADVNLQNEYGESALHLILRNKNFKFVQALVDAGAEVNTVDGSGTTPFHYVSKLDQIELVKKMLPMVKDIDLQDEKGKNALHLAIWYQNYEVADVLLDEGAEVDIADTSGCTAFHYACSYGDMVLVERMLPLVTDINLQNDYGQSALHLALHNKNFFVAQALVDEGANVNLTDYLGTTAFSYACKYAKIDLVKAMIPKVANINFQNKKGESALHKTFHNQHLDVAYTLLDAGIDVNLVNFWNETALFCICKYDDIELVERILETTADINSQNELGKSVLHKALQNQNFKVAESLVGRGADVNLPDSSGTTAFLYACKFDELDLVTKMLPMVADINLQNEDNESALHLAVKNQSFEVAHALVDKGAEVNSMDASGATALFYSCKFGETNLVKKILSGVADVNLQNDNNESPLHLAIGNRNFEVAHCLIDAGAEVNCLDASGATPFLHACKFAQVDLVKKMLPMVTDKNLQNPKGENALSLAVSNQNFDVAHVLVDEGVDVNSADASGTTSFHYGCKFGQIDLVKKMLPTVADINSSSRSHESALHLATRKQNFEVAHALLDEGAVINSTDASGTTAFFYACKFGQIDLVKKMLPTVADINLQNEDTETALHLAVRNQSFKVAHALVDEGADVNSTNASGMTPFFYACKFGQTDLVKKMLPMVADINLRNKNNDTALHIAILNKSLEVAHALIDEGADVNSTDASGTSAFFYACQFGQTDLVMKMLSLRNDKGALHESIDGSDVPNETEFMKKRLPMIVDLNLQNEYGESALHVVLHKQNFDMAHVLVEEGADVNLTDTSGFTAFFYACKFATIDLVKKMIPMVTDIDLQKEGGETALHQSIKNRRHDVAHALIDEGADVNLTDSLGTTPFLYSCLQGDVDLVKKILPKVTDLNIQNTEGETALHLAIKSRNFEVAHALIDGGADVNLPNSSGTTPFLYNCVHGKIDIKKILSKVTNLNLQNVDGESALLLSIKNRCFEVAHVLVDEGADVNLVNSAKTTALLYACVHGKVDLVKKILPNVTDINLHNEDDESALHLAVQHQNAQQARLEIIQLLTKHGVNKNLQDRLGCTVLHLSCWSVYSAKEQKFFNAVASILLQEPGIDFNLKNVMQVTPLDLARANTEIDPKILEILENQLCSKS